MSTDISSFNANGPGIRGRLFGLPFEAEDAGIVIVPVPWEATVTYRAGTAAAPQAILDASIQIDLFHPEIPEGWKLGMAMLPVPDEIRRESDRLRELTERRLSHDADSSLFIDKLNEAGENLNIYVKNHAQHWLRKGKIVGLVGGDHSTSLGLLRALSERYDRFGILQIDAHADLRKAYEGVIFSHGSIMHNAMKVPGVHKLVQVGIRDFCEEEWRTMQRAAGRIQTFFMDKLSTHLDRGTSWESLCEKIVAALPDDVYISLDVDGLDPSLCPQTGTPVPSGLTFTQTVSLIRSVVKSGRRIIAFDVVETGAGEWDANVAARLLWQLCHWTAVSQRRLRIQSESE